MAKLTPLDPVEVGPPSHDGHSRHHSQTPTNTNNNNGSLPSSSSAASREIFQGLFKDLGMQAMAMESILRLVCGKVDKLEHWVTEMSFGMTELDMKLRIMAHNIEGTAANGDDDASSANRWSMPQEGGDDDQSALGTTVVKRVGVGGNKKKQMRMTGMVANILDQITSVSDTQAPESDTEHKDGGKGRRATRVINKRKPTAPDELGAAMAQSPLSPVAAQAPSSTTTPRGTEGKKAKKKKSHTPPDKKNESNPVVEPSPEVVETPLAVPVAEQPHVDHDASEVTSEPIKNDKKEILHQEENTKHDVVEETAAEAADNQEETIAEAQVDNSIEDPIAQEPAEEFVAKLNVEQEPSEERQDPTKRQLEDSDPNPAPSTTIPEEPSASGDIDQPDLAEEAATPNDSVDPLSEEQSDVSLTPEVFDPVDEPANADDAQADYVAHETSVAQTPISAAQVEDSIPVTTADAQPTHVLADEYVEHKMEQEEPPICAPMEADILVADAPEVVERSSTAMASSVPHVETHKDEHAPRVEATEGVKHEDAVMEEIPSPPPVALASPIATTPIVESPALLEPTHQVSVPKASTPPVEEAPIQQIESVASTSVNMPVLTKSDTVEEVEPSQKVSTPAAMPTPVENTAPVVSPPIVTRESVNPNPPSSTSPDTPAPVVITKAASKKSLRKLTTAATSDAKLSPTKRTSSGKGSIRLAITQRQASIKKKQTAAAMAIPEVVVVAPSPTVAVPVAIAVVQSPVATAPSATSGGADKPAQDEKQDDEGDGDDDFENDDDGDGSESNDDDDDDDDDDSSQMSDDSDESVLDLAQGVSSSKASLGGDPHKMSMKMTSTLTALNKLKKANVLSPEEISQLHQRATKKWFKLRDHVKEKAKKDVTNILLKRKKNIFTVSNRIELLEEKSREVYASLKQLNTELKGKVEMTAFESLRRHVQDVHVSLQVLDQKMAQGKIPTMDQIKQLAKEIELLRALFTQQQTLAREHCDGNHQETLKLFEDEWLRVVGIEQSLEEKLTALAADFNDKWMQLPDYAAALEALRRAIRKKADLKVLKELEARLLGHDADSEECLIRCLSCHKEVTPDPHATEESDANNIAGSLGSPHFKRVNPGVLSARVYRSNVPLNAQPLMNSESAAELFTETILEEPMATTPTIASSAHIPAKQPTPSRRTGRNEEPRPPPLSFIHITASRAIASSIATDASRPISAPASAHKTKKPTQPKSQQ